MPLKVLFLHVLIVFTVNAGEDVEDLIEKGYTCSLATANEEKTLKEFPGVRIVCDDGFCSKCVKTDEGINVLYKRDDIDQYLMSCHQEVVTICPRTQLWSQIGVFFPV